MTSARPSTLSIVWPFTQNEPSVEFGGTRIQELSEQQRSSVKSVVITDIISFAPVLQQIRATTRIMQQLPHVNQVTFVGATTKLQFIVQSMKAIDLSKITLFNLTGELTGNSNDLKELEELLENGLTNLSVFSLSCSLDIDQNEPANCGLLDECIKIAQSKKYLDAMVIGRRSFIFATEKVIRDFCSNSTVRILKAHLTSTHAAAVMDSCLPNKNIQLVDFTFSDPFVDGRDAQAISALMNCMPSALDITLRAEKAISPEDLLGIFNGLARSKVNSFELVSNGPTSDMDPSLWHELETNYHLESFEWSLIGPLVDENNVNALFGLDPNFQPEATTEEYERVVEKMNFYTKLNKAGRGPLLTGDYAPSTEQKWVDKLVEVHGDTDMSYYFLRENPGLFCSCASMVEDQRGSSVSKRQLLSRKSKQSFVKRTRPYLPRAAKQLNSTHSNSNEM